ncbi:hypothetical protein CLU79DRAFT_810102 [Phycomyces nitens]|nr:hypothetical protein CLU79DRAFT_810102 [Phycomyces nitens]
MDALLASTTNYQAASDFWLFVVYCLVVIVVVLFFFFYYNRVIALLITWLINQYTWRQFNAYIEVDSIRFTVLGARILFKNLRYISTNQTISIVKGHLTVRYWLMNVRKTGQDKKTENNTKLPCRIVCSLEGLEIFMYNNVPVYEGLKDTLGINTHEVNDIKQTPTMQEIQSSIDPESHEQVGFETSLFQRLVPIEFECTTGALMIGNAELQTMLVCQVAQASGIVSTAPSRTTMDHFKTITDLVLGKLEVHIKENMDFSKVNAVPETPDTKFWSILWYPLKWFIPSSKARQYGGMQHIHTLMNSQKREAPPNSGGTTYHEEYGRVSNMIECSKMAITYYSDSPGLVPSTLSNLSSISTNDMDVGNGGLPPEWGVRVSVWNAMIHYGPWTDRQRSVIQDYFFPSSYRNNAPTPRLQPGQQRMATCFDFHLEFMTEATLRFPTRERSKDWKYDEDSDDLDIGVDGYYTRPYGWLDIKAGTDSSVKLMIPYVYGRQGCASTLDINLKNVDVSTSINYASFLKASNFEMKLLMNSPLEWNAHRVWEIKASTNRPHIFLLRDHIFLFQDMLKDLSSEPLTDILYFIPTTYKFYLDINDPFIYLCVNEHNIISNPNAIDDNAFIKINSRKVHFNATLPFTEFEPEVSSIQFDLEIEQFRTGISLQASHTLNAFLEEDNAQFGAGVHLRLDGSYEYYNSVDVSRHIESLNLDIKLDGITVKLFGTVIRYLVILKENYFGRWVNFSTIEEYRQRRANPEYWKKMRVKQADSKPIQDPLEVYILLKVQDGAFILPENLYDCTQYSQMEFQELQLELRNLDIYMDTHVNFSPITWTRDSNPSPNTKSGPFRMKNGRDPRNHVYIEELNIHGHLMYGPLPEIATYLGRWNFDIGRVMGELKPSFLLGTTCFAQTFIYNLIDEDNAVPAAPEDADMVSLPDVTFVKATVKEIDVYLMSHSGATEIYLKDGIMAEFDNWVNRKYSQRISLQLPSIQTICLANQEQPSLGLGQENEFSWVEVAKLELGLNITIFRQTKNWRKERNEQQTFIRTQDNPTRRCFHLYDTDAVSQSSRVSTRMSQEYHVGVLYAPPFRSFYLDDEGVVEPCDVESNLTRSASNNDSCYQYAKGSSVPSAPSCDEYSESGVESYPYEKDTRSSQHRYSAQSGVSRDDESFHTAISYADYPDSQRHSDMDLEYVSDGYEDASNESAGEIDSEEDDDDDENEAKRRSFECHPSKNSTTEPAIPPSIPYSGYLKRYRVKRATSSSHGHSFFHPYLPPPRTCFIPQNDNEDIRDRGFKNDMGEMMDSIFAGFEDTSQEPDEDNDGDGLKENETTATTVLEATSPVTILLTPIFVKIAQELTEAINKDDWDLETMLDSLQIEYIAQLTRYLTDQFICSRVAILTPKIYLHFIQDVMIPDDLPAYKHGQSHINTKYDQEDALLCSADISLEKLYMICSFKFQDFAYDEKQKSVAESKLVLQESRVHIDLGKLDCKVRYISGRYESNRPILFGIPPDWQRKHQPSPHNESTEDDSINELNVIDLELNNLELKWLGATKPNYLNVGMGNISAVIITESAEILLGAVYSWLVFVNDLKSIMSGFQDRRARQIQVFIHEIANFSTRTHVKSDPLFLTKPTNILRLGSRNFRNDVGWKLLARMRHCLRSMPSSEREKLQYRLTSGGAIKHIDSRDMFVNVVTTFSRWRNWEIGSNAVSHCRLLTQPFKQKVKNFEAIETPVDPLVEFLTSSVNLAKIRVDRLEFYIYEEEKEQDHNSLVIGSINFAVESMYKQSSVVESVVDGTTKKVSSVKDGYLDLVAKATIGSINITANPVLMAFAKHMLMVQRMFTRKLRSMSNASSYPVLKRNSSLYLAQGDSSLLSEDATDSFSLQAILAKVDILAQVLVSIDDIDICAMAQKLRMQGFIKGIQSSVLFSNPKLTPPSLVVSSEKADSDTGSGIRSSNKASRRNLGGLGNRIIFEAAGGLDVIDIRVYDMARHSHPLANKLLEIILDGVNLNANMSHSPRISRRHVRVENSKKVLNVFSNIHKFHVHAPQSLLKLYGFVEDWRTEQGKTYHFMYQNLLKEWEEQRTFDSSPLNISKPTGPKYDIKLQFLLNQFVARSDLLPSLSIEYNIEDFFVMVHELQQKDGPLRKYAFQISKQVLHIITKATTSSVPTLIGTEDYAGGVFGIPGIRSNGSLCSELQDSGEQKLKLKSKISIDFISLPLNVGMIDSLLTAHSLLGNEIMELLEVLSYSKQRREATNVVDVEPAKNDKEFTYSIEVCLDGLRIAATSPSAVGIFESNMLEAKLSSETSLGDGSSPVWKVQGHDFALSLDHSSGVEMEDKPRSKDEDNYQRNRLAYIMIDFDVSNHKVQDTKREECKTDEGSSLDNLESYHINLPKVQTVMQPIALGKLAEMYIYYETELKKRKEMKKMDLERLANNTKLLVQSFKSDPPLKQDAEQSLLKGKRLSIYLQRLGVAIPLDNSDSSAKPRPREISALLFSITSLRLVTQNIEKCEIGLENISLQFVKKFDQNKEEHFMAENHPRMNQMLLPLISCNLYTHSEKPRQFVKIDAKVGGFEVDIDGTITDYINTLGAIYVKSMDRVDAFSAKTNTSLSAKDPLTEKEETSELVYMDIKVKIEYLSGSVRLYPKRHSNDSRRRKDGPKSIVAKSDTSYYGRAVETNMVTIKLPGLSALVTYQTPLGSLSSVSGMPKRFHGDILVHESDNILHPSLVQFLHEVVAGLKIGIQQSSEQNVMEGSDSIGYGINASILLRLSRSKLDLSCQPFSKVVCSLGWEEGEFLMNSFSTDTSSRTMSCVGYISDISVIVKHNFSPEACLTATVDRVLLNAMLGSQRREEAEKDDISIVVDIPSIVADVNIRYLNDLLNINTFWFASSQFANDAQNNETTIKINEDPGVLHQDHVAVSPLPFSRRVAVHFQSIQISVDMGQAIGRISLKPKNFTISTYNIPFNSKGLDAFIDEIYLSAEGRLSGEALVSPISLKLKVDLLDPGVSEKVCNAASSVIMQGVRAKFEYEYQNILDFLQGTITFHSNAENFNNSCLLSISIDMKPLLARLSIKTVPIIVTMYSKFNELLKKKKAEAGIQEMPSTINHQSGPIERKIAQKCAYATSEAHQNKIQQAKTTIDLTCHSIGIIIYPSQFQDSDNVEVCAQMIKVSLERAPNTNEQGQLDICRKLVLGFTSAALLKNVPGMEIMDQHLEYIKALSQTDGSVRDSPILMAIRGGTNIVCMPSTTLTMDSTQTQLLVEHIFSAKFGGRISVSLNLGLMRYLQEMSTMFTSQLNRALEPESNVPPPTPINETANMINPPFRSEDTNSVDSGVGVSTQIGLTNPSDTLPKNKQSMSSLSNKDNKSSTKEDLASNDTSIENDQDDSNEKLEYQSKVPVDFYPQLQVMADATPPVEWLGLKRETLPALVHENLTLNLEKISQCLWTIYAEHTT